MLVRLVYLFMIKLFGWLAHPARATEGPTDGVAVVPPTAAGGGAMSAMVRARISIMAEGAPAHPHAPEDRSAARVRRWAHCP